MRRSLALLALCLVAGCGAQGDATLDAASTPSPTPSPTPNPIPSFATPESAMTYLADAWNRGDIVSLKHVTDPAARAQLEAMHREATDLRLKACERRLAGDYECTFTHGFPAGYTPKAPVGKAAFLVGPARRSGWYMTVFAYCGDGDGT